MSLDFTLTPPTTAIGAGTPSRAISITLSGSGTLTADASFALSDGGAGGTFFPSSPVSIASGQTTNAVTQFVYIPTAGATGTIPLTVTPSGGLTTAARTLGLPIANNATTIVSDSYSGTAGLDLASHAPNVGGPWVAINPHGTPTHNKPIFLNGSGGVYLSGATNSDFNTYYNTGVGANAEYDISGNQFAFDTTDASSSHIMANQVAGATTLNGYRFGCDPTGTSGYYLLSYVADAGTVLFLNGTGPAIGTGNNPLRLSIRRINSNQYLFPFAGGTLINGTAYQDNTLTSGLPGVIALNSPSGSSNGAVGSVFKGFTVQAANWSAAGSTPPSIGAISATSTGSVDTITYPAPTAGSNAVAGVALYVGTASGAESATPYATHAGTGSGSFTHPTATSGTFFYTVKAYDGAGTPLYSNPSNEVSVSSPSVAINFGDNRILLPPFTWRIPGDGSAIAQTGGAPFGIGVSGATQLTLTINPTVNASLTAGEKPCFKVTVDDLTPTYVQATTASTVQLASGLSTSAHTILVECLGGDQTAGDGWTGQLYATVCLSLSIDSGATFSAFPSTDVDGYIGDSYLMSFNGSTFNSATPYNQYVDYTRGWSHYTSTTNGAIPAVVAYGGTGLTVGSSASGAPIAPTWIANYDPTHARSFGTLKRLYVALGINDHGVSAGTMSGLVQTTLTSLRTKLGSSAIPIYWVTPSGGESSDLTSGGTSTLARDGILAGVAAYRTASGDTNAFAVDLGSSLFPYFNFAGQPTTYSLDGIHPTQDAGQGVLAAQIAAKVGALSTTYAGGGGGTGATIQQIQTLLAAGVQLAANGLDLVQVEPGINARQALSPILAASAGNVSGSQPGASNVVIKGANSSTTRITSITDQNGNRTNTLTLPT